MYRAVLIPLILLLGCAPAPAGPAPAAGPFAYVANQDAATVSVIDLERRELARVVDLRDYGFDANAKPHHVAVEPDGSHWYVSLIGAGRVLKFDRQDRLVGQVRMETPGLLALHPTEDLLLVGRSMTAVNPPRSLGVVRRSTMELDELGVPFPRPHALAVRGDGSVSYTASLAVNQMLAADVAEEEVELHEVGGPQLTLIQFAVSPDGSTLVATAELTGQVLVFDVTDPWRPELRTTVDVGARPWHPVFSPDGRWLYVPAKGTNAVEVLDTRTWSVVDRITGRGLSEPHGSALSPDGRTLVVSNNNLRGGYVGTLGAATAEGAAGEAVGVVVLIDTATREVVEVIEVGPNPTGVGAPARW